MMRMPTDKKAIAPQKIVEAAVSAALHQMQAARPFDFAQGRLCHHRDYFGAREATIFSKRGSPRSR
jgi:hypothetical protein